MTNPITTPSLRIVPDKIVGGLFVSAVILLLLGPQVLMGTSSRNYFDGAPFQATLGTVTVLVGAGLLIASLVLLGVRAIAQQQIDILLSHQRCRCAQSDDEQISQTG